MIETIYPGAGETPAILAAGAAISVPRVNPGADGLPFVIVPPGFDVQTLPVASVPPRPRGTALLRDAKSFVAWVKRHTDDDTTTLWATLDPATFLCVVDDHLSAQAVPDPKDNEARANWRQFRGLFAVPASREFRLWQANDRKDMSQLAFAEFLQDNLPDVIDPPGADLLTLALNFETASRGTFKSAQRLQDGSATFTYQIDQNDGGNVTLPAQITISIPIFENEAPRELTARLRHRTKDGEGSPRLMIRYELVRPHVALENAFRETWQTIEAGTGRAIFLGWPEGQKDSG